jgi:hypothetical protein
MHDNNTQRFFDAAIDLLLANGNRVYGDKRWSWDKEGGHCYVCLPLDFDLITKHLTIPHDVTLDYRYNAIATVREYLDLRYQLPTGHTPPYENGAAPSHHSWSPLWLVHRNSSRDESAVDRAFNAAIKYFDARPLRHTRPPNTRYVDAYWQSLQNAVLECRVAAFPQQPIWLSRWRFHTYSRSFPVTADVQFITPDVSAQQPALKAALLPIAFQLAETSGLDIWDHQEQRLVD